MNRILFASVILLSSGLSLAAGPVSLAAGDAPLSRRLEIRIAGTAVRSQPAGLNIPSCDPPPPSPTSPKPPIRKLL
jgi:hypothetical protein